MAPALNYLRWRAMRASEQIGLPGALAAVVLLGLIVGWLALTLPIVHRLAALEDKNADLARQAAAKPAAASRAPLSTADQLAEFERGFLAPQALSQSYSSLWNLARKHGLQLRQADFKLTDSAQDAAARYSIILPLSAEYPSLRAFIGDALHDNPALALEEMSVRRADARSTQLDARLRFVLFVRRSE